MKGKRARIFNPKIALLVFLGLFFLTLGTASAQDISSAEVTDDQVNEVASQLYCPVCENIPLDVCGTPACIQWRALIREQLSMGWTEREIKDYFAAQYGDRVLAVPPARGLNWLFYVLPPLAILAGGYILFRVIRSWRQASPQDADLELAEESMDDEYVARIEDELRRR
jgi:cytochrome c-type biogenesis protein CcmH